MVGYQPAPCSSASVSKPIPGTDRHEPENPGVERQANGFTLSELLIALGVLGLIAAFTIPKVLTSMGDAQKKACAKEAAMILSQAYEAYQLQSDPDAFTTPKDLIQFVNGVEIVTSGEELDGTPGNAPGFRVGCSGINPCVKLHNGGLLWFPGYNGFSGTTESHFVFVWFDPDGSATGTNDTLELNLYYNGLIRSWATLLPNSITQEGVYNPDPSYDPAWFSWD